MSSPTPVLDRLQLRPSAQRLGRPRRVEDCLGIAALSRQAHYLGALDQALRKTLPKHMQDQVRLAAIKQRRLVFLAPSPAWASRLRTLQPSLLAAARSLGLDVESISVKMSSWTPPDSTDTRIRRELSAASALHLTAAAQHLTDPQLQQMFLALAARRRQHDATS